MTIAKQVHLAAPPARVYAALTTPAEIVRYYPYERVEADAVAAGRAITFLGQLDGQPFTDHGEITVAEPGREFAYRYWSTNHGTPRTPEHHLTIRYRLAPTADGGTAVAVSHESVPEGQYVETMQGVWDYLLGQLAGYVATSPAQGHPTLPGDATT